MFQNLTIGEIIAVLVTIFICMGFHEAMHAFVAHWLGDTTAYEQGRLTLNPLKHIDIMTTVLLPIVLILVGLPPIFIARPVPFNPDRVKFDEYGAALIGVAGPLTNFFLAVAAAVIVRGTGVAIGTTLFNYIDIFIVVNLAFFVFNMIPFPPLDGSRLLYAFAPEPLQEIMYRIESSGLVAILIFFFIIIGLTGNLIPNIIQHLHNFLLA